jgi:hypothetical protein
VSYHFHVKLLSNTVVTAIEEPDLLEFTVTSDSGLIESVAGPVILIGFVYLAWVSRAWWLFLFVAFVFAYMVLNRSKGNISKLKVNDRELVFTDDFEKTPNRQMRFKHYDVRTLGFSHGGEGGPVGLYLNDTCALAGLNRQQADAVAFQIFTRFPQIGSKDSSPTSLLHGDDSGITTLGLPAAPPK